MLLDRMTNLAAMDISSPKNRYESLGSYGQSTSKELSEKLKPDAHSGEDKHCWWSATSH